MEIKNQELEVELEKAPFDMSGTKLRFIVNNTLEHNFNVGVVNGLIDLIRYVESVDNKLLIEEESVLKELSKEIAQVKRFESEVSFVFKCLPEYESLVSKYFPNNEYSVKIINSFKSTVPMMYPNLCGRLHSLIRSDVGVHSIEDYYAIKSGLYLQL